MQASRDRSQGLSGHRLAHLYIYICRCMYMWHIQLTPRDHKKKKSFRAGKCVTRPSRVTHTNGLFVPSCHVTNPPPPPSHLSRIECQGRGPWHPVLLPVPCLSQHHSQLYSTSFPPALTQLSPPRPARFFTVKNSIYMPIIQTYYTQNTIHFSTLHPVIDQYQSQLPENNTTHFTICTAASF